MQHQYTMDRQWWSGRGRFLARVQRQGSVGLLVGLLLLPVGVLAQGAGDLDTSFGGEGTVITDFGTDDIAYAVALQPDGKIVVAGRTFSFSTGTHDFALARYHPNGTLDSTFGDDGLVTTDFGSFENVYAIALQPDGKIVVSGVSSGDFALARYHADGTLDLSFGDNGRVTTNFGDQEEVFALAVQSNSKLVVAGISFASGSGDFALARYHTNGTIDTTFNGDGKVTTNFSSGSQDGARALALQPNGKLIVAGFSFAASGNIDFALARYHADGSLDLTFGDSGKVTTDFGGREEVFALALQSDGKIVVAGRAVTGGNIDLALARYHPDGTLDTAFSGDGKVTTDFGGAHAAYALAIQGDNRIVVAGDSSGAISRSDFVLARYRSDGTLDMTFGDGGLVTIDFGGTDAAAALAIQPLDGRLVVAGTTDVTGHSDFALARYHAITCGDVVVTRIGTNGNDVVIGTSGPDVINAFGGSDILIGLGGNDLLCGNLGKDILLGSAGDDILRGGPGKDILLGGPGKDMCNGGAQVSGDTAVDCEIVTNVP